MCYNKFLEDCFACLSCFVAHLVACHRQFDLNLSAMYTHITCQCSVVCVCVGAIWSSRVHGLSFQTICASVALPPTSLTPYLSGSVVNTLGDLNTTGSKHMLDTRRQ